MVTPLSILTLACGNEGEIHRLTCNRAWAIHLFTGDRFSIIIALRVLAILPLPHRIPERDSTSLIYLHRK